MSLASKNRQPMCDDFGDELWHFHASQMSVEQLVQFNHKIVRFTADGNELLFAEMDESLMTYFEIV